MKIEHIIMESKGLTMTAIHFSNKKNLTEIDAAKHGNGIVGAERTRARDYSEYYNKNRVYFYKKDSNFKKESGLGNNEYVVTLMKIYDMNKDKDKLKKEAIEQSKKIQGLEKDSTIYDKNLAATLFENIIKKRGHDGFWDSKSNIIIYFRSVKTTGNK
jgi:hypothetical protein